MVKYTNWSVVADTNVEQNNVCNILTSSLCYIHSLLATATQLSCRSAADR